MREITMRNLKTYYSASVKEFLNQSDNYIVGVIHSNDISAETTIQQNNTWFQEIQILKEQLKSFTEGRILFEYTIPRMGKRVDAVLLYKNIVFLLEFKCGDSEYRSSTYDQVYDYALDLRNFQKESHNKLLVPIMISTAASKVENNIVDITRNDAGAENLTITTNEIDKIIEYSKQNHKKSICFVTGVPGAGKTLVGLNIAIERSNAQKGEHAVFLSGNYPLVTVLQEALARDKIEQEKLRGNRLSKKDALRNTSAFIQIIHKYRDSFVGNSTVPPERVAIFDEAQRAWTHEMISKFMATKKGVPNFQYSEPEFLISTMDRHKDWAVIICLVGGGQEINTGEAGLPEWFDSLRRAFPEWDVYITPELNDNEYRRGRSWSDMISNLHTHQRSNLHLSTSVRSFRTPDLAAFVKAMLDVNIADSITLLNSIKDKYPIVLTRDLTAAKQWVRNRCQGTTRYGLLASSGGLRLKPEGIFVKNEISVENWFLNGKDDVRSSYALEDVVTEFDIQGLELDYSIVAWDADFRFDGQNWTYNSFVGNKWNTIRSEEKRLYLKNAYRVLLTRARQGMAIFIPRGDDEDTTRKCEYYDAIYNYLISLGVNIL